MGLFSCFLATFLFALSNAILPNEDPNLFEGDIILDPDQRIRIEQGNNPMAATAGAIWPAWVPYEIEDSLKQKKPAVLKGLQEAFDHYKEHTCIRFKQRTWERQYILFTGDGGVCSSHIGPNVGGVRKVTLGGGGCHHRDVIVHELMHALGFWHEQSRPDRDNYIDIIWDNIPQNGRVNFKKYSRGKVDSLGVPYDLRSIMHYTQDAWTGNKNLLSIKTKDPSLQYLLQGGRRPGLSDLDIKQLNLLYKCDGSKAKPPPTEPPCSDYYSHCNRYVNRCKQSGALGEWLRKDCQKTCNTC